MRHLYLATALAVAVLVGLEAPALAQSNLPIPEAGAARDVPGALEQPDPNLVYKVVFDIKTAPKDITQVNPGLLAVSRFFNTLATRGVSADHRKVAVVIHQDATEIVQKNEAFRARNEGHDNPNIALMQAMAKAGVEFHVCGQAVTAKKIDPKNIQPEVELDLWALTTMVNLELRGYVHVGG
jgi:intracellular sulfur oxidation DsrE/DsrF family protein